MYIWNRFLHQLAGQLKRAENIIRQRIKRQETNQMKKNEKCYTNRELSWLQFNERVLNEAGNPRVPLAERMTLHPFTRRIWTNFSWCAWVHS